MAKKKKKINFNFYLSITIIALSAISVLMIFFNAYYYNEDVMYNGLQASFGFTNEDGNKILTGNFLTLLAFVLPIGAIVLTILFKKSPLMALISGVALLGAGILAFSSIATFPDSVVGQKYIDGFNSIIGALGGKTIEWQLGVGLIVSGITSFLASIASFAKVILKK